MKRQMSLKQALKTQLMAEPEPRNAPMKLILPLPPSVNGLYPNRAGGGRRLSDEGKAWKCLAQGITWAACVEHRWKLCCRSKVVVELRVWWPDFRDRDTNNLHKLLADALEMIVYFNDKQSLLRDINFEVDRERPRVELKIFQKEGSA